jgi:hypothetical protein
MEVCCQLPAPAGALGLPAQGPNGPVPILAEEVVRGSAAAALSLLLTAVEPRCATVASSFLACYSIRQLLGFACAILQDSACYCSFNVELACEHTVVLTSTSAFCSAVCAARLV